MRRDPAPCRRASPCRSAGPCCPGRLCRDAGPSRDAGQATVELALLLPLVAILLLALVQAAVVARDHVLVAHAAREAARTAAVEPDENAVRRAAEQAGPLAPDRLTVDVSGRGEVGSRVRVAVTYTVPTRLPFVGQALDDVTLRAEATMRVER